MESKDMFSNYNYRKRRKANEEFQNRIEILKQTIEMIEKHQAEYNATCTHDLVLYFGKEGLCTDDTGYAECLCCGKTFHLKENIEDVTTVRIIDLVGVIPEEYLHTYLKSESMLTVIAKEKLDSIVENGPQLSLVEVKELILSELIKFAEDRQENFSRHRKKSDQK